jgi:hypothetical protein
MLLCFQLVFSSSVFGFKLSEWLPISHDLSILFKGTLNEVLKCWFFSSSFLLVLQLWVTIVIMVIVAMS